MEHQQTIALAPSAEYAHDSSCGGDGSCSSSSTSSSKVHSRSHSQTFSDSSPLYCSACLALSLGLGLITGAHWLVLWHRCTRTGQARRAWRCRVHVLFYWVAQVLFWAVRQTMLPWFV